MIPRHVLMAALAGQQEERPSSLPQSIGSGLLSTGLAMMANSATPGATFASSFGKGALTAGLPAFQKSERSAQEKVAIDELTQGMPPEMAAIMRLNPNLGLQMYAASMQEPEVDREIRDLADGRQGVFENGRLVSIVGPGETVEAPTSVQEFEYSQQNPDFNDFLQARGGPLVEVITGDRAASAAASALGGASADRVIQSASQAEGALNTYDVVSEMMALLENPAAKRVMGPGSNIRTALQRFSDDPTAREIAAAYDALAGQNVLQGLDQIPGAISEGELRLVERINAGDRNMTVEELQSALEAIQRLQGMRAEAFVQEFNAFDPSAYDVTPAQMQQYRNIANRAQQITGTSMGNDPLRMRR